MKNKIINKENSGIIFIAGIIVLCTIAMLGVFGVLLYFKVKGGSLFGFYGENLRHSVNLLSWIVLGIVIAVCAVGQLFKMESEDKIKAAAGMETAVPEHLERRHEIGVFVFDIFMVLTFLFMGVRFFIYDNNAERPPLGMTLLLLIAFAAIWFSQKVQKSFMQRMKPEKRDDLRDDQIAKHRGIAYRSGYRTYKKMARVLFAGMLVFAGFAQYASVTATALFIETGVIWIIMNGIFRYENRRLTKKAVQKGDRKAGGF